MKTFESYFNLKIENLQYTKEEEDKILEDDFLELSHYNELEITFDFIGYDFGVYELIYMYKNKWLFIKTKNIKEFFLSGYFKSPEILMYSYEYLLKKYFDLEGYKIK